MACFLRKSACIPALLLAGLLGCTQIEEEQPWEPRERPMMLFTDTTILDLHEGGRLAWKLKTAYLERWEGTERIFAKPILVDIYDSTGAKVAFLRADSGSLDTRFSYVNAYGRVYALSPKGASVRADSLVWNKRENLVRTESPVRVVSEDGDVLQGKGFLSDNRLENWHIQSNVTAIFQDAARRIKEEDGKQSATSFPDSAAASPAPSSSAAPPASPHIRPPLPPPAPPRQAQPASRGHRASAISRPAGPGGRP